MTTLDDKPAMDCKGQNLDLEILKAIVLRYQKHPIQIEINILHA